MPHRRHTENRTGASAPRGSAYGPESTSPMRWELASLLSTARFPVIPVQMDLRMLGCVCNFLHFDPETKRPHIDPHFFNVSEAFRLGATLRCVAPAGRIRAVGSADGILLFVIHHDSIFGVFCIVFVH